MKVLFTPQDSGNPYQSLLAHALEDFGVEVGYYKKVPKEDWLIKNRQNIKILHLHWPHTSYYRNENILLRLISLLWFGERLVLARILGYRIVWTVHNLMPHESECPIIDYVARVFLCVFANDLIVHCGYAKTKVRQRFGRKRNVHIIPHGNYLDAYLPPPPKKEARADLGVPQDSFVFLFLGSVRPYKGVENLISAFKQLNDPKAVLLLAGKCVVTDEKEICELIKGSDRIKHFNGFVSTEKLPFFFAAADCIAAPFTDVLTSGSIILGLSYGKPIVAPSLGCLPELLSEDTGLLYKPDDKNSLHSALQKALEDPEIQEKGRRSYQLAQSLDWRSIAKKTHRIFTRYQRQKNKWH